MTRLRTTLSRSKSRKKVKKATLGLMERTMYENLDYYKTLNYSKTREQQEDAVIRATLFPQ